MKIYTILAFIFVLGCSKESSDKDSYTLYRSSVFDEISRVHVATFDSKESEEYNRINCQIAADLFQNQPGVSVKYWCEKGRYRK